MDFVYPPAGSFWRRKVDGSVYRVCTEARVNRVQLAEVDGDVPSRWPHFTQFYDRYEPVDNPTRGETK